MRRLYLLRHAKSSHDDRSLADLDRPLNRRGERACSLIAEHLREAAIAPQLVVCSPARRTRETLERITPGLIEDHEVSIDDRVYEATVGELLELVRELPEQVAAAMLIGHNPAIQQLALALASPDSDVARIERKLPTAALVSFAIGSQWRELDRGKGELLDFVRPKQLDTR